MGDIIQRPSPEPGGLPAMPRPAAPPPAVAEEGIDPRRVVEAVYRRRRTLFIAFLLSVAAAVTGAALLPTTYTARTSVLVLPENESRYLGGGSGGRAMAAMAHVDLLNEFVRSNTFMVPTLNHLGMLEGAGGPKQTETVVRSVQSRLKARPVGAAAFEVTYSGRDAESPMRILDGVVNGFIDVSTRTRAHQAEQSVKYLETQLGDYRQRVAKTRAEIERFQAKNAELLAQLPESTSSRLSHVEDGLVEARMSAVDAQMRIKLIREQMASTPRTIVSEVNQVTNPRIVAFQARLSTAEAEYESLRARYTDEHPDVRAKAREIEGLRRELAAARVNPTTKGSETTRINAAYERLKDDLLAAQNQFQASQARVQQFSAMLEPTRSRARNVPVVRQRWEMLQTRARTQEALYGSLMERIEQARLAGEMDAQQTRATYQLIDPARLLPGGEKSRRTAILLAGIGAGLLVGLTLVGLQEMTDRRIHTPDALERTLGLPVLAAIPLLPEMPRHVLVRRRRGMLALKIAVAVVLVGLLFVLGMRTRSGNDFIREVNPTPAASAGSAPARDGGTR